MAERERHEVRDRDREAALALAERRGLVLSGEQADALAHVTDGSDLGRCGRPCRHRQERDAGRGAGGLGIGRL
jgi:hypothetical protein